MSKLLLSCLFAGFAGLAAAVTINWQSCAVSGEGYSLPTSITTPGDPDAGTTLRTATIRATVEVISSASGTLLQIGENANNPARGIHLILEGGTLSAKLGTSSNSNVTINAVADANTTLSEGRHEIAVSVSRTNGTNIDAAIFIDGQKTFELTGGDTGGGYWLMMASVGKDSAGANALDGLTVEEAPTFAANVGIADMEEYYRTIPEPTALALLGLGLAALTLRRRAA